MTRKQWCLKHGSKHKLSGFGTTWLILNEKYVQFLPGQSFIKRYHTAFLFLSLSQKGFLTCWYFLFFRTFLVIRYLSLLSFRRWYTLRCLQLPTSKVKNRTALYICQWRQRKKRQKRNSRSKVKEAEKVEGEKVVYLPPFGSYYLLMIICEEATK